MVTFFFMILAILRYDKIVGYNVLALLLILVKRSMRVSFELDTSIDWLKWNTGMTYGTRKSQLFN